MLGLFWGPRQAKTLLHAAIHWNWQEVDCILALVRFGAIFCPSVLFDPHVPVSILLIPLWTVCVVVVLLHLLNEVTLIVQHGLTHTGQRLEGCYTVPYKHHFNESEIRNLTNLNIMLPFKELLSIEVLGMEILVLKVICEFVQTYSAIKFSTFIHCQV